MRTAKIMAIHKKITIFFLLISTFFYQNLFCLELSFNDNVAKITEDYKNSNDDQYVFVISNIAYNSEVQRNIANILEILKNEYKNDFKIVGLEGDYGFINTKIIRDLPIASFKKNIIKKLVEKNLITGAEAFMSNLEPKNESIFLYGIDDWQLLNKNNELLKMALYRYSDANQKYKEIQTKIKEFFLKNNPKINELYDLYIAFIQKDLEVSDFVLQILAISPENEKKLQKYPNLSNYLKHLNKYKELNFIAIERDANFVIEALKNSKLITKNELSNLESLSKQKTKYFFSELQGILEKYKISIKNNYTKLNSYLDFLNVTKNFEFKIIDFELKEFFNLAVKSLAKNKKEQNFVFMQNYFFEMRDFFTIQITYSQFVNFISQKKQFWDLFNKYFNIASYKILYDKFVAIENFYLNSDKKAELLVKNLFNYDSKIIVMIVNGFYKDLVVANLRLVAKNYTVIEPVFESYDDYDKRALFNRLNGKLTKKDYPIINSIIYSNEFRVKYFEILGTTCLEMQKQLSSYDIFKILKYMTKLAIENDLMAKFDEFLTILINKGYKRSDKESYTLRDLKSDLDILEDVEAYSAA